MFDIDEFKRQVELDKKQYQDQLRLTIAIEILKTIAPDVLKFSIEG